MTTNTTITRADLDGVVAFSYFQCCEYEGVSLRLADGRELEIFEDGFIQTAEMIIPSAEVGIEEAVATAAKYLGYL